MNDIYTEFEHEKETKEKPTLKRLLKKGYEPCGMFSGYVVMVKSGKQILYNNLEDEVVKDKKYAGNKFFSDKE